MRRSGKSDGTERQDGQYWAWYRSPLCGSGRALPLVFVHGPLSDGGYWADQIGLLPSTIGQLRTADDTDYPNANPDRDGYSAVVDADNLAAFIRVLHLGKVGVVGHSYGALTALFLAARHL
ncbi:MAG: alpha/beta fold hydrolase [Terriglobales bacterium]